MRAGEGNYAVDRAVGLTHTHTQSLLMRAHSLRGKRLLFFFFFASASFSFSL